MLGQEQDSLDITGGGFDKSQSFSGKLTQVEIWNKELPIDEIEKMANCVIPSTMESDQVVSWFSEKWENHNISMIDTPLEDLCKPDPILNQLVWPEKIEHHEFKDMCDILQGYLPMVLDNESNEPKTVHDMNFKVFDLILKEKWHRCFRGDGGSIAFWLGIKNLPSGNWANVYQLNQTVNINIKKYTNNSCLAIFGERVVPFSCDSPDICGICKLPQDMILYMKGICPTFAKRVYDIQYFIHGVKNDRPYFK